MTIELGANVLQTDTDVVWLSNPYYALKKIYGGHQLVTMADQPLVNAGVFYAQNVRTRRLTLSACVTVIPTDPPHWMCVS